MPLKRLGKPPYLIPEEVEQDDVLEIIEQPYVVPAEKTKWGKERGKAQVKILRNNEIRTWSLNITTWDKLLDAFGEDPGFWLGKKVQVKKEMRNINGVDKTVLFGRPYKEPQQHLDPKAEPSAPKPPVDSTLAQEIAKMTPEEKQRLLEMLQT